MVMAGDDEKDLSGIECQQKRTIRRKEDEDALQTTIASQKEKKMTAMACQALLSMKALSPFVVSPTVIGSAEYFRFLVRHVNITMK